MIEQSAVIVSIIVYIMHLGKNLTGVTRNRTKSLLNIHIDRIWDLDGTLSYNSSLK